MLDIRKTQLEQMIAQTALGNRQAFTSLYEMTSAKLYAVCLSVLRDRPEAEEALQEVYVKIWTGAGRYASNGLSPMTWLITIARNTAIDRYRARASQLPLTTQIGLSTVASGEPSAEAATIRAQEKGLLDKCLEQLDKDRAGAIRAVYLEGMSYADLAKRQAVPLNTVRSWLRRSLISLKECVS